MARINFDTAKRLDITVRPGDSFELELTLKDSSGIPINLFGSEADGSNTYEFKMMIIKAGSADLATNTSTYDLFASLGHQSQEFIVSSLTDDANTTTADTSDASYVAETAATGKVTLSLTAAKMRGTLAGFPPLSGFLYDIQYVDPATLIALESTQKTILYGSFNFVKDISYTS